MIDPDTLAALPLFAGLPPERLAHVADHAADLELAPGAYVMHEGEIPAFFVVLAGKIEITKRVAGIERVLGTRGPSDYFGEVPLTLGSATFANARAAQPSRVMRLDPVIFHELVAESPALSHAVARSMSARVGDLQRVSAEMPAAQATIVGPRYDPASHDVRDFLARNQVPFDWLDPGDPALRERASELPRRPARYPLVRMSDGRLLEAPSLRELACALGLDVEPSQPQYDLLVAGGGPAGLAAAVYGASEGLRTLMVEREAPGGQAGTSSRIENYLGFPAGLSGDDLGHRALQQAQRLGAEIVVTREVRALHPGGAGGAHAVELDGGELVHARAVVLATGVAWRTLPIAGIERFTGRGVYYGAARSEAATVRGKDIYLIGAGNSAGQAAVFFSSFARSVTFVCRGPSLEDAMSAYLIAQLREMRNVRYRFRTAVAAVEGDDHLRAVVLRGPEGETRHQTEALFVFIGADARTEWLPDAIARDERGYVLTGPDAARAAGVRWPLERDPFLLETSVPAVFAAGDVRHGSVKRVAAAVGEGSMAIALVHQAVPVEAAPAP